MPAILPHAATEICRHALGNERIKEALLQGPMYSIKECTENGIFHSCEADFSATLARARALAAYPAPNIKAFGQMKTMLHQPAIDAAGDPQVGKKIFADFWGNESPAGKSRL